MNTHTSYKFKKEYWNETVVKHYMGKKYIITAQNLTDQTAQMILSDPSRRHVLEPTGPIVPVHMPDPINKNIGGEKTKIEANKAVEVDTVTENQGSPNAQKPKVKSLAEQFSQSQQPTSTSTEQVTVEQPLKKKPGPKPKSK